MANGRFLIIQWPTSMHMWVELIGPSWFSILTTKREQMKLGGIQTEGKMGLCGYRHYHILFYAFIKFPDKSKDQKHNRSVTILKTSNYSANYI